MKKLLLVTVLSLIGFTSNIRLGLATEFCVAQRVLNISYSGEMHYRVMCNDRTFNTKRNIVMFLLPLPYGWNAVALKNLNRSMSGLGLTATATIGMPKAIRGELGTLRIYERLNSNAAYCVAHQFNIKSGGLPPEIRFDAVISCNGNREEIFRGITSADLTAYAARSGYASVLESNLDPLTVNIGREVVELKKITVFRTNITPPTR